MIVEVLTFLFHCVICACDYYLCYICIYTNTDVCVTYCICYRDVWRKITHTGHITLKLFKPTPFAILHHRACPVLNVECWHFECWFSCALLWDWHHHETASFIFWENRTGKCKLLTSQKDHGINAKLVNGLTFRPSRIFLKDGGHYW